MRFQGQSALVTGPPGESASPPRSGAEVLAVDVLPIPEARTKSLEMDLASEDGPRRVAEGAHRLFARVDILVNNAGVGDSRALGLADDERLEWTTYRMLTARPGLAAARRLR